MAFVPDTVLVHEVIASPNHGERMHGHLPDMLLLHYTGMPSADAAIAQLASPSSEVSCHYVVTEQGRIIQMVPEARRAWHAGQALWDGETDINSCSIGIEIVNPGHDDGNPGFPGRQIAALTALCRSILRRRIIRPDRVLAHSDVAPARKRDPGEKFPWDVLHRAGIGHWVKPAPVLPGPALEYGDSGDVVASFQRALRDYGYGIETEGYFDEKTREVVTAFQRHYRPQRCDGKMDSSTLKTLRTLLDARDRKRNPHEDFESHDPAKIRA
jgi:N-acetylmuramoyl-L-alanine amidase